ncbi:LysR family transcriptional regulator [Pseudogemmobacter bohemicus]|uniref:LysR family transcriptional regulator n=1 Tax=Pseudogemmobacter bohemicus TaxID=2250708 RepID=UPI000DD487A2|nr:LysR family transcriptional regulator [Pseudogemmobacter bohemicus]
MDTAVLRTYVHIIEEGSFAGAARRMGVSRSLVSKYVSDLEARLGAQLLTRSTRSLSPTELGRSYFEQVRAILQHLDEAEDSVRQGVGRVAGKLRIGAPVSFTLQVLNPHVMRFMEAFPDVRLDLSLDDGCVDPVAAGFDATIRVGMLEDSAMRARHLCQVDTVLVASPAYLAEHGSPEEPADLAGHRILYYTNSKSAGTWPFRRGEEVIHQKVTPAFSTNNGDMIRTAALDGQGIALTVGFQVATDLAEGRLVPILTRYGLPELPVSVIWPTSRNMSAALRAFVDFLGKSDFHA